jgi:CheY-like chemotaxis protein
MASDQTLQLVAQDSEFRKFHDLMARKVQNILLVSTAYDAWVMEEDCKLSERIVSEYQGLNLSRPPRLTWASSAEEALAFLNERTFELIILMPQLGEREALNLGKRIKALGLDIPVCLLTHREVFQPGESPTEGIDRQFIWTGNADLLVALVKSAEDAMNVDFDTKQVGIRVIIVVEDSPRYQSYLLPILYRELVVQTQEVIREGLNQEHRLLTMRCRPKILLATTYEDGLALFRRFEPYVLSVISDVRFPREGQLDPSAGVDLLSAVKAQRFDIPLLLMSNEPENARRAAAIPACFVDKNSPTLLADVRRFVLEHLGFGDFVFRNAEGAEIARASNIFALEERLKDIPYEVLISHSRLNDFSRWFFARTEFDLADKLRPMSENDFASPESLRAGVIRMIHSRRQQRQKGIVANFNPKDFDPDTDFFKVGDGSLGGKARGLAFLFSLLNRLPGLMEKYPGVDFAMPKTLAIATEGFDSFVQMNDLGYLSSTDMPDEDVLKTVENAPRFPKWLRHRLKAYLARVRHPLAVRSSSLLEDAQFQAYAGLYSTIMVPNNHSDPGIRLEELMLAIKQVWASTFFQAPKAFSRRVSQRSDEEKMGVLVQQVIGEEYGGFFYPAVSGVCQSYNYYPFGRMKPEDGVATVALGFGKIVVDGGQTLRFSPRHPNILPQCPTVELALRTVQTEFYSLSMECWPWPRTDFSLERRNIVEAEADGPLNLVASTFLPEEGRIRDTASIPDRPRVLLFAPLLKHKVMPLAEILQDIMALTESAMGCPVEMEFACNLYPGKERKPVFSLLQLRPMTARADLNRITITDEDRQKAFCLSTHALGNAEKDDVADIVFVRPETFEVEKTMQIAAQIGRINARLLEEGRKYLLVGPGRWGTMDRWLGIPVAWNDICGVAAIVETASSQLRVEPSQGSHFFHNITTLGINYIMVSGKEGERFDWDWLERQEVEFRDEHVVHVRLPAPLLIKVDGRTSHCAIRTGNGAGRREAGPAFKSPGCCTLESGEPGKPGPCAQ